MAKYYNNIKKTGKVAGSVFSIRFGETIERAYNPVVANPSTPAQVSARAKLKLMSQLSAVLGTVIAIPRVGAVSSRNAFVKLNYPTSQFQGGKAVINLPSVKLTKSIVALPAVNATSTENGINVNLASDASGAIDRMVYVFVIKRDDDSLAVYQSVTVSAPGDGGRFGYSLIVPRGNEYVVLGYGIRANTEAGRAVFGDLEAPNAEQVAQLLVNSTLLDRDLTLTETRGIQVSHMA